VKLSAKVDSVILNAAECEPLLHKDKEILRYYPDEVLEGLGLARQLVGAQKSFIGIKGKYEEVIELLAPKVDSATELCPLTDSYPAGDELILVFDVLHRVVPPGGIPLAVGVVVINVETALNIAKAVTEPVVEKFLTIAGAVRRPVTLRVPIGIRLEECLQAAGGVTGADPHFFIGGVMMGRVTTDTNFLIDKTVAGVVVLPGDHPLVERATRNWKQQVRIGRSACDQCSYCTELCPRWLLGHPIEPHRAMRSLGFNRVGQANVIGTAFCCECNLCSLYSCPEDLDPKDVCAENKRRLAADKIRWQDPPFDPRRPVLHLNNRRAPMARLITKLGLQKFENVGPLNEDLLQTNKVGIKLKQHTGQPCLPVVQEGDTVRRGQIVGQLPRDGDKPALGAIVHASIDGKVTQISDGVIWIENPY